MARILIVEDEQVNAELAAVICKAARHTITIATNGVEALMVLDALPFDLVLTDVIMPRMDGIAMTHTIRSSDTAYANLPIIGITAKADLKHLQDMRNVGMDEVITKPFRNHALLDVVTTMLERGPDRLTIFRAAEDHPSKSGDLVL